MVQLNNAVALVTSASRGAGRGIALELGAAGATVYVTGRSSGGRPTTDNVPGTIDETAREVTDRGGRGIAVRCEYRRRGRRIALRPTPRRSWAARHPWRL